MKKQSQENTKSMRDLTKRNIRYICFRLKDIADGGAPMTSGGLMEYSDEVKSHMESQSDFGGWNNFGKTWDVDKKAFLVVVLRTSSIQSEWDKIVADEAQDLPT